MRLGAKLLCTTRVRVFQPLRLRPVSCIPVRTFSLEADGAPSAPATATCTTTRTATVAPAFPLPLEMRSASRTLARGYSSEAAAAHSASLATSGDTRQRKVLYTPRKLLQLRSVDIGTIFKVDPQTTKSLAPLILPEEHKKHLSKMQEWSFLVRPASVDALKVLSIADAGDVPSKRLIVHGASGCGKSTVLTQALLAGKDAGWTLVHLPNAKGLPHHRDLDPCLSGEPLFDQNVAALEFLSHFRSINSPSVLDIPIQGTYEWGPQKMQLPAQATYQQLFQLAEREDRFATDVVRVLLKEVCANAERRPVLVAIDDINGLFQESSLLDFQLQPIARSQLKLVTTFERFVIGESAPVSGVVMAATTCHSSCPPAPEIDTLICSASPVPEAAGQEVGPLSATSVDAYSAVEAINLCAYFQAIGWLSTRNAEQNLHHLRLMTGLNPRRLYQEFRAL